MIQDFALCWVSFALTLVTLQCNARIDSNPVIVFSCATFMRSCVGAGNTSFSRIKLDITRHEVLHQCCEPGYNNNNPNGLSNIKRRDGYLIVTVFCLTVL